MSLNQVQILSEKNQKLADDIKKDLYNAEQSNSNGKVTDAKGNLNKADDEVKKITDGVMDILDRPENDSWTKSAVANAKSIIGWHQNIERLAKLWGVLGYLGPRDPKQIAKLEDAIKSRSD